MPRRFSPRSRSTRILRWLGLGVVLAIAVGYIQPIRAYLDVGGDVAARRAEHSTLLAEQVDLRHRLELADTDEFIEREARRLGLVRPGERLFIVGGIEHAEDGGLP